MFSRFVDFALQDSPPQLLGDDSEDLGKANRDGCDDIERSLDAQLLEHAFIGSLLQDKEEEDDDDDGDEHENSVEKRVKEKEGASSISVSAQLPSLGRRGERGQHGYCARDVDQLVTLLQEFGAGIEAVKKPAAASLLAVKSSKSDQVASSSSCGQLEDPMLLCVKAGIESMLVLVECVAETVNVGLYERIMDVFDGTMRQFGPLCLCSALPNGDADGCDADDEHGAASAAAAAAMPQSKAANRQWQRQQRLLLFKSSLDRVGAFFEQLIDRGAAATSDDGESGDALRRVGERALRLCFGLHAASGSPSALLSLALRLVERPALAERYGASMDDVERTFGGASACRELALGAVRRRMAIGALAERNASALAASNANEWQRSMCGAAVAVLSPLCVVHADSAQPGLVLARHAFPSYGMPEHPDIKLFYFEVRVDELQPGATACIGLAEPTINKNRPLGYSSIAYAWSSAGRFHSGSSSGRTFGKSWSTNDVVGCGWRPETAEIFFTLNGALVGVAQKRSASTLRDLFPSVSVDRGAARLVATFTPPFAYRADGLPNVAASGVNLAASFQSSVASLDAGELSRYDADSFLADADSLDAASTSTSTSTNAVECIASRLIAIVDSVSSCYLLPTAEPTSYAPLAIELSTSMFDVAVRALSMLSATLPLVDDGRHRCYMLLGMLRIVKCQLYQLRQTQVSAESLALGADDMRRPSSTAARLRAQLNAIVDCERATRDDTADRLIKSEACQALAIGFEVFYPDTACDMFAELLGQARSGSLSGDRRRFLHFVLTDLDRGSVAKLLLAGDTRRLVECAALFNATDARSAIARAEPLDCAADDARFNTALDIVAFVESALLLPLGNASTSSAAAADGDANTIAGVRLSPELLPHFAATLMSASRDIVDRLLEADADSLAAAIEHRVLQSSVVALLPALLTAIVDLDGGFDALCDKLTDGQSLAMWSLVPTLRPLLRAIASAHGHARLRNYVDARFTWCYQQQVAGAADDDDDGGKDAPIQFASFDSVELADAFTEFGDDDNNNVDDDDAAATPRLLMHRGNVMRAHHLSEGSPLERRLRKAHEARERAARPLQSAEAFAARLQWSVTRFWCAYVEHNLTAPHDNGQRELEARHDALLRSTLLRNGLANGAEPSTFAERFLAGGDDSPLWRRLTAVKLSRSAQFIALSARDEHVHAALRHVVVAVLRHTGVLSNDDDDEALFAHVHSVYGQVVKMKKWFVHERQQSMALPVDASSTAGIEIDAQPPAAAASELSYAELGRHVIERARFLCTLTPALSADEAAADKQRHRQVFNAILDFVQMPLDVAVTDVRAIVEARAQRVERHASALRVASQLLDACGAERRLRDAVLANVSRCIGSSSPTYHYFASLWGGASASDLDRLYALAATLLDALLQLAPEPESRLALLPLFLPHWQGGERDFALLVCTDALRRLLDIATASSSAAATRALAWRALRLLATRALRLGTDAAVEHVGSLLYAHLIAVARQEARDGDDVQSFDRQVLRALALFELAARHECFARAQLGDRRWLDVIEQLMSRSRASSAAMPLLVSVLRFVLPRLQVADVVAAGDSVVDRIVALASRSFNSRKSGGGGDDDASPKAPPASVSSAAVSLLRALHRCDVWSEYTSALFGEALRKLAARLARGEPANGGGGDDALGLTTLFILGGHLPRFAPGMHVTWSEAADDDDDDNNDDDDDDQDSNGSYVGVEHSGTLLHADHRLLNDDSRGHVRVLPLGSRQPITVSKRKLISVNDSVLGGPMQAVPVDAFLPQLVALCRVFSSNPLSSLRDRQACAALFKVLRNAMAEPSVCERLLDAPQWLDDIASLACSRRDAIIASDVEVHALLGEEQLLCMLASDSGDDDDDDDDSGSGGVPPIAGFTRAPAMTVRDDIQVCDSWWLKEVPSTQTFVDVATGENAPSAMQGVPHAPTASSSSAAASSSSSSPPPPPSPSAALSSANASSAGSGGLRRQRRPRSVSAQGGIASGHSALRRSGRTLSSILSQWGVYSSTSETSLSAADEADQSASTAAASSSSSLPQPVDADASECVPPSSPSPERAPPSDASKSSARALRKSVAQSYRWLCVAYAREICELALEHVADGNDAPPHRISATQLLCLFESQFSRRSHATISAALERSFAGTAADVVESELAARIVDVLRHLQVGNAFQFETLHPYRASSSHSAETVCAAGTDVPPAEWLEVLFDERCALEPGDTLTFEWQKYGVRSSTQFTSITPFAKFVCAADQLTFRFECAKLPGRPRDALKLAWGVRFVVVPQWRHRLPHALTLVRALVDLALRAKAVEPFGIDVYRALLRAIALNKFEVRRRLLEVLAVFFRGTRQNVAVRRPATLLALDLSAPLEQIRLLGAQRIDEAVNVARGAARLLPLFDQTLASVLVQCRMLIEAKQAYEERERARKEAEALALAAAASSSSAAAPLPPLEVSVPRRWLVVIDANGERHDRFTLTCAQQQQEQETKDERQYLNALLRVVRCDAARQSVWPARNVLIDAPGMPFVSDPLRERDGDGMPSRVRGVNVVMSCASTLRLSEVTMRRDAEQHLGKVPRRVVVIAVCGADEPSESELAAFDACDVEASEAEVPSRMRIVARIGFGNRRASPAPPTVVRARVDDDAGGAHADWFVLHVVDTRSSMARQLHIDYCAFYGHVDSLRLPSDGQAIVPPLPFDAPPGTVALRYCHRRAATPAIWLRSTATGDCHAMLDEHGELGVYDGTAKRFYGCGFVFDDDDDCDDDDVVWRDIVAVHHDGATQLYVDGRPAGRVAFVARGSPTSIGGGTLGAVRLFERALDADELSELLVGTELGGASGLCVFPREQWERVAHGTAQQRGPGSWFPLSSWPTMLATGGLSSGRWYYEATLDKLVASSAPVAASSSASDDGECGVRVGFVHAGVKLSERRGVGDHAAGFAFDGGATLRRNGANVAAYGTRWRQGDVVGCMLDLTRGTVAFTLNGVYLGVAFNGLPPQSAQVFYPAWTVPRGASVKVNLGHRQFCHRPPFHLAPHAGLLPNGAKRSLSQQDALPDALPTSVDTLVGRLDVLRCFVAATKRAPLPAAFVKRVDALCNALVSRGAAAAASNRLWPFAVDAHLAHAINRVAIDDAFSWTLTELDRQLYGAAGDNVSTLLVGVDRGEALWRALALRELNVEMRALLPFVNLADEACEMSALLVSLKPLMLTPIKGALLSQCLDTLPKSCSSPEVHVRRVSRISKDQRRERDTVFAQLFAQLGSRPASHWRHADRAWETKLVGEAAIDDGGVLRETIAELTNELCSPSLPLFVESPNGREAFGQNQDAYVVNVQCVSRRHMAMYRFIGRLIGFSLCSRHEFKWRFASTFWKPLVGSPRTLDDLGDIDLHTCNFIDSLRRRARSDDDDGGDDDGSDATMYFTAPLSDGSVRALVPGGERLAVVGRAARLRYANLIEQARLHEDAVQTDAVLSGLDSVVPLATLRLFTWQELAERVCGIDDFDVDELRRHCQFSYGIGPDSEVVGYFWSALRSFDREQRCRFLRFAWGQQTLPPRSSPKFKPLTLQLLRRPNPDATLPTSAACYFKVSLPAYTSEAIMRRQLLFAISNCVAIDTDGSINAQVGSSSDDDADLLFS
jgi:HECT-domain (ubiquitin-transferase)/SPRY domain